MTELLIILIIVAVVAFAFRKPRPSLDDKFDKQYRDMVNDRTQPIPEIIEDSSHLKADLAATQEKLAKLNQELGQLQSYSQLTKRELEVRDTQYLELSQKFDKLQSQKKSGEVRLGHVAEQVIPMLPEFPVPINTLKFFGNPIDYISIDMDAEVISFIEVKSGDSTLSDKQKKIRKMINEKKIQFFEVRVNEKGIKVK